MAEYSTQLFTNGDGCMHSAHNKWAQLNRGCKCTKDNACEMSVSLTSRAYMPHGNPTNFGNFSFGNKSVDPAYAFGMGAAESIAYDYTQKYAYSVSEQVHHYCATVTAPLHYCATAAAPLLR